jgi:hypothetical protein
MITIFGYFRQFSATNRLFYWKPIL